MQSGMWNPHGNRYTWQNVYTKHFMCVSIQNQHGERTGLRYPAHYTHFTQKRKFAVTSKSGSILERSSREFWELLINFTTEGISSITNADIYRAAIFRVCKSVHHHTFNWINQPDAATSQVYCLSIKYSSTCFGHPHAHHQELQLQYQPLVLPSERGGSTTLRR